MKVPRIWSTPLNPKSTNSSPNFALCASIAESQPSIMASLVKGHWRAWVSRLGGGSRGSASTTSPSMNTVHDQPHKPRAGRGDYVPVYVALGLILMSAMFGVHIAKQQLLHSPNVYVNKKKRETIPEVEDPDYVVKEADKFLNKSIFRKVAHIQDLHKDNVISDPIRGDALNSEKRVETLKSVGVDPKHSTKSAV